MEKLYGSILGLTTVIFGSLALTQGLSPVYASALILLGLGISLLFERKVIKETSTILEKKLSANSPVIAELAVVGGIAVRYGFYRPLLVYVGLVLLKNELHAGLSTFNDINTSRLMGRIARMVLLGLGIAGGFFTDYIVFYAVVASGLTVVYDLGVILHESASGI